MNLTDVEHLNRRHAIAGHLNFTATDGFIFAEVENAHAHARVALQGAQVVAWRPRGGAPVIWLSEQARFAAGKSIRGGVPVCWPWFGPHATDAARPGHGYARTVPWQLIATEALAGGETRLTFALVESEATAALWPHRTPVQAVITVGATLSVDLVTRNEDDAPVTLGEALHTYFQVGDIAEVEVQGLEGRSHVDKVDGGARKTQQGPVSIAGEVDRVYLDTTDDVLIVDNKLRRRIRIAAENARSTIVWNPWVDKAAKMGDLGEDGYRHMLCVESGNALDNVVTLAPGAEHRMGVTYRVEPLQGWS
ncbi:MAG: D-hexose-6-phosphate mutarotase [Thiohalomonadaceae bacterium]